MFNVSLHSGIVFRSELKFFSGNSIFWCLSKRYSHSKNFDELNNMYQEMFTPTENKIKPKISQIETIDGIDQVNEELKQIFGDNRNCNSKCIDGTQLETITNQDGRFVINSLSNNPYYNLALEDYIFRHTPLVKNFQSQRLITYINQNCAVIGKNQIIWKEVFLNELKRRNFELLRRFSGGGTVIHDLGNVNYSFINSRDNFERTFFNKNLIYWLNKFTSSKNFKMNDRGDIMFNGLKCSGSAYKISKGKSYHHGTMLISSNLDQFQGLLKPENHKNIQWDTSSVESVRSNITNINLSSTDEFIQICNIGFKDLYIKKENNSNPNLIPSDEIPVYFVNEEDTVNSNIIQTMKELESNTWKYLSGPKFKISLPTINKFIEVEKGIINNSNINGTKGLPFQYLYQIQGNFGINID